MKKIVLIMLACLALVFSNSYAQSESFDFTGLGVGVTFNVFNNGETPQNLEKGWELEVSPIFKVGEGFYIAPNFNYSRQYQTAGGGLNGYYRLGSSENFKILMGATSILGEIALSPDSTSGVAYNNVIGGGFEFVIQWRNFYGISPTLVLNQSFTTTTSNSVTKAPKPERETTMSVGVVFGASKKAVVLTESNPTMGNRVFSKM